ncbi:MAG: type II toxin-antitoxin system VapC family toxin [Verrucomicrobia bacterium]|nr:type II toxin-antitoxin system VapC family toxin [Verrucomicrobiota bacterium]
MPIVNEIKQHKILLDTHVWLWLMTGEPILSLRFRRTVSRCQKYNGIYISPISIWEVGMLVEKKRIQIEMDCLDWVEQALESPGVHLVPISPRIAIQSTRLPYEVHGDPADRMLISTAHESNAILVTCDEKLIKYGSIRHISVHDPRH